MVICACDVAGLTLKKECFLHVVYEGLSEAFISFSLPTPCLTTVRGQQSVHELAESSTTVCGHYSPQCLVT